MAEYEAHKASHSEDMLDMVKASHADAVPVDAVRLEYRMVSFDGSSGDWHKCNLEDYNFFNESPKIYETRALGVIDQWATPPESTMS